MTNLNVGWFQIQMNDVARMRVSDRIANLEKNIESIRERPPPIRKSLLQDHIEPVTGFQIHGEIRLPRFVDADIVHGDDVRVFEQRGKPRLPNQWIKEQIACVFMQTSHRNVTIPVPIEDLEDTFHAADRD